MKNKDVNAVVVANTNEDSSSATRARSRQRIVQRSGRTVVSEQETLDSEHGER